MSERRKVISCRPRWVKRVGFCSATGTEQNVKRNRNKYLARLCDSIREKVDKHYTVMKPLALKVQYFCQ